MVHVLWGKFLAGFRLSLDSTALFLFKATWSHINIHFWGTFSRNWYLYETHLIDCIMKPISRHHAFVSMKYNVMSLHMYLMTREMHLWDLLVESFIYETTCMFLSLHSNFSQTRFCQLKGSLFFSSKLFLLTGERKIGDGFVDAYELIKHLVSFVSLCIIICNHAFVSI